jgi:L-ascorbate metabolism protein UlaG (beta-lactamase superfamily)
MNPAGNGPGDRLTFVGHSTLLIELGGIRLLTDPVLGDRVLHIRRHAPMPAPDVAKGIDAVLLSHLHHDHLDLPSLRTVGPDVRVVVPRGAGAWLGKAGFSSVEEVAPGETTSVGGVELAVVRADHKGHRWPFVGPRGEPVGYVLRPESGPSVYFAGDTDLFSGMHDLAGTIDLALLPVWGWGTSLGSGHLDPRRAAEAAARIRPKRAVPIHWGTLFPIGRHRTHGHLLHDPPREFAAHVAELAPSVEVALLEPGESLALIS